MRFGTWAHEKWSLLVGKLKKNQSRASLLQSGPKTFKRGKKKGLCPQELFVFCTQTRVCRWDPVSGLLLKHKNKKVCRTLSKRNDRLSLGSHRGRATLNLLHVHAGTRIRSGSLGLMMLFVFLKGFHGGCGKSNEFRQFWWFHSKITGLWYL